MARLRLALIVLVPVSMIAATRLASTQPEEKPAAQAGAALFRDKGCTFCHGATAAGTDKGPALIGLNASKEWTPARISNQIVKGGQKMPPFGDALTDEEVAQLVAYLKAKNRPAPPPVGTH